MPGPLRNGRRERYAQEFAAGKTATEAMELAGYGDPRNSTRLTKNDEVSTRIAELQAEAAKAAGVSVESLLSELEASRAQASGLDLPGAAIQASMGKARISGLDRQRIEVGTVGEFDACETTEEVADALLRSMTSSVHVTEQDRQGLAALMERHGREVHEYIAGIKAKPVAAAVATASLPHRLTEAQRHRQLKARLTS